MPAIAGDRDSETVGGGTREFSGGHSVSGLSVNKNLPDRHTGGASMTPLTRRAVLERPALSLVGTYCVLDFKRAPATSSTNRGVRARRCIWTP